MNNVSFRKIGSLVRKLNLRNGDILLFKKDSALAYIDTIKHISDEIAKIRTDVLILVVDDLNDVRVLHEDELRRAGWVKINSLAKLFQKENADANKDGAAPGSV